MKTKNKLKLKPCPGCGSTSICVCYFKHPIDKVKFWRAHCQDCDWSFGGSSLTTTEKQVRNGWNKRKNEIKRS